MRQLQPEESDEEPCDVSGFEIKISSIIDVSLTDDPVSHKRISLVSHRTSLDSASIILLSSDDSSSNDLIIGQNVCIFRGEVRR